MDPHHYNRLIFVHREDFPPLCGISYEKDNLALTRLLPCVTRSAFFLQFQAFFVFVFFVSLHASFFSRIARCEALGLLVPLGFDIAAFTPAAYLRGSLPRPSMEISSWSRLRA